jgi:dipeptidyl aminopeptidase/acylaminoacyl peptidase
MEYMMRRYALAAALWLAGVVSTGAAAQSIGIADLFRPPAYFGPTLSQNGKYLAVSVPINGRMNIAVLDLESRKVATITAERDFDILGVNWVGNERLVFTLGQLSSPTGAGRFDGGGLYMVTRDGKQFRKLSATVREQRRSNQFVYRYYELLRTLPGNDEEVIVVGNQREAEATDVYRMNVRTGRATLITERRPERTVDWVLDNDMVPRVVRSRVKGKLEFIVHYRKSADAPWEEISRYDAAKGPAMIPLAFESDNQTLQVAYNGGRDTMAVFRYDPNARKMGDVIAQHPRFDMGADQEGGDVPGPLVDFKTNKILGYRVEAEKPQTVWVDETYARLQRTIDATLPGTHNTFRRTPDGDRVVITSSSDVQPTRWYMLDEKNKTMEELLSSRPWIKPDMLVEQRPFLLKTRDGLEIPSYYFLPKGYKAGQKLPTVVHVHGGPSARADFWGRLTFGVREAQLLASRGYAVVVPNFRITPGLGNRVYYGGFGTIGRQMSDDHEDAARWAVDQGFADPQRICISGASYGGYAALMALTRPTNPFKCGVAGLVVSDLEMQVTSPSGDTFYNDAGEVFWNNIIGAERPSRYPRELSPVHLADRIKAPVFMYAGLDDIRTPVEQTVAMRRALERAGNPPKTVFIALEEGHGFGKVENNVELYTKMLEFLDTTIGPKSKQ